MARPAGTEQASDFRSSLTSGFRLQAHASRKPKGKSKGRSLEPKPKPGVDPEARYGFGPGDWPMN